METNLKSRELFLQKSRSSITGFLIHLSNSISIQLLSISGMLTSLKYKMINWFIFLARYWETRLWEIRTGLNFVGSTEYPEATSPRCLWHNSFLLSSHNYCIAFYFIKSPPDLMLAWRLIWHESDCCSDFFRLISQSKMDPL